MRGLEIDRERVEVILHESGELYLAPSDGDEARVACLFRRESLPPGATSEDRVLHTGDLFSNGVYPNIDLEAGGSVRDWPATLDRVLTLDFDTVIPGHGPLSDRAGLVRFHDFMASLWTQTKAVADRHGTLDEALRTVDLGRFGLGRRWFAPYLDRRFVIRRAWQEASAPPG